MKTRTLPLSVPAAAPALPGNREHSQIPPRQGKPTASPSHAIPTSNPASALLHGPAISEDAHLYSGSTSDKDG